jgi:hypothetical protein
MSMSTKISRTALLGVMVLVIVFPAGLRAGASGQAKKSLEQLLLGKNVKSLTQLPATKEGVDIYYTPPEGKEWDQSGLDLKHLTRWLKERGVGVESSEAVSITDVKIGGEMIEVHLAGGGAELRHRRSRSAQSESSGRHSLGQGNRSVRER